MLRAEYKVKADFNLPGGEPLNLLHYLRVNQIAIIHIIPNKWKLFVTVKDSTLEEFFIVESWTLQGCPLWLFLRVLCSHILGKSIHFFYRIFLVFFVFGANLLFLLCPVNTPNVEENLHKIVKSDKRWSPKIRRSWVVHLFSATRTPSSRLSTGFE